MRYLLCLMLILFAATGAQAMQPSSDEPIAREYVDRIGNLLVQIAPQQRGRILLIAELDDDWMGSRLLWHAPGAQTLRQLDTPAALSLSLLDAGLEAWAESSRRMGRTTWTMMTFLVEDGRFSVRVSHPPSGGDDDWEQRAEAEVARVFNGLPIEPARVAEAPTSPVRNPGETVPTASDVERIRNGLIAAAGSADAKIVLFARFDERVSASAIRYRADNQPGIRTAAFSREIDPGLTEIWNAARERMGENVWREIVVVVDHGVARIALRQPSNPDFHAGFSQAATEIERAEFPPLSQ